MTPNNPEQKSIKGKIINPPERVGIPECKLCYGKGYSSELTGQSWGSDLGVGSPGREDILNMKPCKCTLSHETSSESPITPNKSVEPKPKWLDDHACAYNDGKDECKCFKTAYLLSRSDALREVVEMLEARCERWEELRRTDSFISGRYEEALELVEVLNKSLLTNPKDK